MISQHITCLVLTRVTLSIASTQAGRCCFHCRRWQHFQRLKRTSMRYLKSQVRCHIFFNRTEDRNPQWLSTSVANNLVILRLNYCTTLTN
ncbi:hypothetical protein QBC33DRAFT_522629 [Phialemonium atrogriseum]|uniref:Secreted protein n=1 Tax=Phialemonium atrogriseum TaxID=1093897 RepID=A0AAJ0FLQ5_9PEZI|nr:uncharacterized protein QBC33DRAFT_522629 [Phialemonium atrogriseum]KAK1772841.1 hypothetical protein QBC33DRAFT_522629 [Phialemonium atrogriseum]